MIISFVLDCLLVNFLSDAVW